MPSWANEEGKTQTNVVASPRVIVARPVRFQTPRDLANVPPGVTDLDICFFERVDDIGMLLIFRAERFAASTMERFMHELRQEAERLVGDYRQRSCA